MPGTAAERNLSDPFDPEQAIPKSAELLDDLRTRFGNLGLAAAAYNGGPGNPNMRYADGVGLVAGYARRMLESVATLHGQSIAETTFIGPAPQ